MPELKKGYNGPEYYPWYDWATKYAKSYAFLLGPRDGYFGAAEDAFVREMQKRIGNVVVDGIFGQQMAAATGYKWADGSVVVAQKRRKIWIYTSPGSGADYWWGPSFELGEKCKNILRLNHQPVSFQKGGYLGLLGGSAEFSYNEVIWDQCKSIQYLLQNNVDAQEAMLNANTYARLKFPNKTFAQLTDDDLKDIASSLEYEVHFSGYSQSADGTEEALEFLFGDTGYVHPGDKTGAPSTGEFRLLRHCIKLVVQFGNPSTKGTGIARKTRSAWLDAKIRNVNKSDDFYAKVPAGDKIRPAFYAIIIEAEMELPFGVHVLRIAVPIILDYLKIAAPLLGMFGPFGQVAVAGIAGISAGLPILSGLFGQAASAKDQKVDDDLIEMLKLKGIIQNVPGLITLVSSLPGLQHHGEYGPADVDQAYDHIASFRR